MTSPVPTSGRDGRAPAPVAPAPAEPMAACQVCGARVPLPQESIFCRVCGEPVIVWGWAP